MDLNKPRPQKQLSQPCLTAVEHLEAGRLTASQSSDGSELTHSSNTNATSPTNSTTNNNASDGGSRDSEFGATLNYHILYKTLASIYLLNSLASTIPIY